jgi:hypothetical protein
LEDEESKQQITIVSENEDTSEEDEMVMSLKTKRFEMAENEEIGKESKKRVRKMSN